MVGVFPLFSGLWVLWVGLAVACPVLVTIAVVYITDPLTRRWGTFMLIAAFVCSLALALPCYLLFRVYGRDPFSETTVSIWSLVLAGGFGSGSLPPWLWRHHR